MERTYHLRPHRQRRRLCRWGKAKGADGCLGHGEDLSNQPRNHSESVMATVMAIYWVKEWYLTTYLILLGSGMV